MITTIDDKTGMATLKTEEGEVFDGLSTAFPKKWTCDLLINRAWSGRCGFEADLNRFALIPQVHRTQSCYYLHQQAVIRPR